MSEYFTVVTDAATGQTTNVPWTEEQIAAVTVRRAQQAAARPVPKSITQRQCRLFLVRNNMLSTVEAAIAQAGGELAIEWEYAQEIARNHPAIPQMATLFNLTDAQIDQFFIEASQL